MTTPIGDYSILLLPRSNYWNWVDAAKDYVAKFGANLTADPASAAGYMAPRQTVTVGGLAGAYPAQGDIQLWFAPALPRVGPAYWPFQSAWEFHALPPLRLGPNQRYLPPTALALPGPD